MPCNKNSLQRLRLETALEHGSQMTQPAPQPDPEAQHLNGSRMAKWHKRVLGLCFALFALEVGIVSRRLSVAPILGSELGSAAIAGNARDLDEPLFPGRAHRLGFGEFVCRI